VLAVAIFELARGSACAQFGFGFGLDMMRPVPSPTQFINDHALVRAGAAQNLPSRNVYANNSNSYISRLRDNGFSSHYGTESHRSPGFEVDRRRETRANLARTNATTAVPTPAPAPPPEARPVHPLTSFFSADRMVVWPSEAPVTDDLKPKRAISDKASITVLDLFEKYRSAPITTVTDARQKLIAYGQPALRLLRNLSTPAVAEGFHTFLLSLYDSLGAAANGPQ
jgi:hypothetical protein